MKAFVTDATGFLGGRLTRKLLERGDLEGIELVNGDLSDHHTLREAMVGCGVGRAQGDGRGEHARHGEVVDET